MAAEPRSPVDVFAEAATIVDNFGPRAPGSDAERRAAAHVAERLRALGRDAEVEPLVAWPRAALATTLHAILAIAASVVSVTAAGVGAGLASLATLLAFVDLSGVAPTTRRLLGRRASQNVVSWGERDLQRTVLIVAHLDSPPRSLVRPERLTRPVFVSLLAVLVCCLLRVAGLSGAGLTGVQFVPTVGLIAVVPFLLDIALAPARAGQNDNASGIALALALAARTTKGDPTGVHVLVTGAQAAGAAGMRAFVARHRGELDRQATVIVNLHAVGSGTVRIARREGPLFPLRAHPALLSLCSDLAEDDPDAGAELGSLAGTSDAYAARLAGYSSITVTGSDRTERLDEDALARAEDFCAELLARVDSLSA